MIHPQFIADEVLPGKEIVIGYACSVAFKPMELIIETYIGFDVTSFKVGVYEQFPFDQYPMAAVLFAKDGAGAGNKPFHTAEPGQRIDLTVKNVTKDPLPFQAYMVGRYA